MTPRDPNTLRRLLLLAAEGYEVHLSRDPDGSGVMVTISADDALHVEHWVSRADLEALTSIAVTHLLDKFEHEVGDLLEREARGGG